MRIHCATFVLALGLLSGGLHAQEHTAHHTVAVESAALPTAEAEVRRVDLRTQKVTLKHGEITNLDMPPMTMVFHSPDATLLQDVQPGDRVRFTAELVNGTYTLRSLERLQ